MKSLLLPFIHGGIYQPYFFFFNNNI